MVQLNAQQEEAKNLIVKWFNGNPSGENLIFIVNIIIDNNITIKFN